MSSHFILIFRFTHPEKAALCYLDNLVDSLRIEREILHTLMYEADNKMNSDIPSTVSDVDLVHTWEKIEDSLLVGSSVLMIQGRQEAQVFQTTEAS